MRRFKKGTFDAIGKAYRARMDEVRLNELDKTEFRDVYFTFKPAATEEDYDRAWDDFQAAKAQRRLS